MGKGFVSDDCLTSTENKYKSSCKLKRAEFSEYLELSSPHVFKLSTVIIYIQFETCATTDRFGHTFISLVKELLLELEF